LWTMKTPYMIGGDVSSMALEERDGRDADGPAATWDE